MQIFQAFRLNFLFVIWYILVLLMIFTCFWNQKAFSSISVLYQKTFVL